MPPVFLGVARQVLAEEAPESASSLDLVDALVTIHGKLGGRLAPVIGHEGYSSLFGRALHLANLEYPFLRPVGLGLLAISFSPESEVFVRLRDSLRDRDPADVLAGLAVVIGSFAWLLSIFIGDDLAHRELRRVWPGLSFAGTSSGSEESRQ
jgi:hypothetical protein